MTDPSRLTDGSLTPGIYRLLGTPEVIGSALAEAGWHPVVVPPSSEISQFYAALATALRASGLLRPQPRRAVGLSQRS